MGASDDSRDRVAAEVGGRRPRRYRLEEHLPVRGSYILNATLVTKENAKDFYFKDSPF